MPEFATDQYLESFAGDEQKFNLTPGSLTNGFQSGDEITFTARRELDGPVVVQKTKSSGAIAIQTPDLAIVTVAPADTAGFSPTVPTDLYFDVQVTRGSSIYTLTRGYWRVKTEVS